MLVDVVAIVVRALSFIAMLQATGIAIFLIVFNRSLDDSQFTVRRIGMWSACAAALLVGIHQVLEAARMTGTLAGAVDTSMLARAFFSKTGVANSLRVAGLATLVFALRSQSTRTTMRSVVGALLVVLSFAVTGHTAVSPLRWLLAPLLLLHLGIIAFWFGALLPLYLIAATRRASETVTRFSSIATWWVPIIALAGVAIAVALVPSWSALLEPYGLLLMAKALGFSLLMGLAALNKLRFSPALARGDAGAVTALRRSIVTEYVLIVAVLSITATMTSLFSPREM